MASISLALDMGNLFVVILKLEILTELPWSAVDAVTRCGVDIVLVGAVVAAGVGGGGGGGRAGERKPEEEEENDGGGGRIVDIFSSLLFEIGCF